MLRPIRIYFVIALLLPALQGCATPQHYAWGKYDETLYVHYKAPQDHEAYVASLKTVMLDAEQTGKLVPPGIYAEYGYALLEEGQTKEAARYFQKERDKWPESSVLMEKMIQISDRSTSQNNSAQPSTVGPAGALEKNGTP